MTREESIQQIKTLIEAWKLDEADLNQTDINAMQVLLKENQELKKQLENKYEKVGTLTSELLYEKNTKLVNQQKEFIKYLEDEIKKEKEDLEHLCDLYKIPQKNNSTYKFVYSYINKIEKILQKYKSIIGVSDETN